MNPYFSLTRFGRLTRTYFIENRASLLLNGILLFSILVIFAPFVYLDYPVPAEQRRFTMLSLVGTVTWGVFTVQQITILNVKEVAITYLLRPASRFEKYLLIILVSGIGFLIVYSFLFGAIDAVGVWFMNHRHWTATELIRLRNWGTLQTIDPIYQSLLSREPKPVSTIVLVTLIHPVSLTLALLYRRFTLVLVALTVITFLIGGVFGNQLLQGELFSGVELSSSFPFSDPVLKYNSVYRPLELPQPVGTQLQVLVVITVVILLYLTAYYRLKEQEV